MRKVIGLISLLLTAVGGVLLGMFTAHTDEDVVARASELSCQPVVSRTNVDSLSLTDEDRLSAMFDHAGHTQTIFLPPSIPLTAAQKQQLVDNEKTVKSTLRDLQSGTLIGGVVNSFGEVEYEGYLYLAARVTSDGQVGVAIDLQKEALPTDAAWQVMAWPKRHGVTGSLTYALVSYGGHTETLTNASAGYSGEGIVNRGCNCFVDAARQIALQRSLSGRCCAHGSDVWQPVTN